ncbi:MAG: ETC complex I subunit [Alphaproteobacteria bacterium]|nr:ETC complex I subunit [Alphaproteobacteria bacterium]
MNEPCSVVIYQPVKNPMQSGKAGMGQCWLLDYEEPHEDARFIEPVMGWTGSSNMQKQLKLRFDTKEEAIAYAERQGYRYTVREPKARKLIKRNYADNFQYKKASQ